MAENTDQPQDKKYVFIDTCVIQEAGNKVKPKAKVVQDCLYSLSKEGYTLSISAITMYENLHGKWGEEAKKLSTLINTYEWKAVSSEVLLMASFLGGLYHDEFGQDRKDISVADKIIAATAILEEGYVLTSNHKDFPNPFFLTEKSFALSYNTYNKQHYTLTLDIALYKPNLSLIARRLKEKMPNKSDK